MDGTPILMDEDSHNGPEWYPILFLWIVQASGHPLPPHYQCFEKSHPKFPTVGNRYLDCLAHLLQTLFISSTGTQTLQNLTILEPACNE